MVSHVVESAKILPGYDHRPAHYLGISEPRLMKVTGNVMESPPSAFPSPICLPPEEDDKEENMFAARTSGPDDLSLSSQVAAMSAFLSKPASPSPPTRQEDSKSEIFIELPNPPTLQHLFDVYFRDFDCYFPFLDRTVTEARIYSAIRRLGYTSYNPVLLVASQDLSLIALTCLMLAMAECLDSDQDACDADSRCGWSMYLQGCRAAQRFTRSQDIDLDIVRVQNLRASYLMHAELLREASQAIFGAFQLATTIKLNDQRTWSTQNPSEVASRQHLWWCIYFQDRRIAQKSGIAYHIRDNEFCVEDFHPRNGQRPQGYALQTQTSSSDTNNYLQALINLARLWGQIWDKFFATGATKKGDWLEIEIMDTQILNARRQLPEKLAWNADKTMDCELMSDSEPNLRRRVQVFTVSLAFA